MLLLAVALDAVKVSAALPVEHVSELADGHRAPVSLLQISKWTWQGEIPATGVPHAPNTPHSTSPDELYKQSVAKAEALAGNTAEVPAAGTNKPLPTTEDPAEVAEEVAKGDVHDIKKQIAESTQAMNEVSDQNAAMNLAKKIQTKKKALEIAQTKEATATEQVAEEKVQQQEDKLVAKEEAAGTSGAVVQATEIAGDAVKNALEIKQESVEAVHQDTMKTDGLKKSIAQSTSAGEVDVLTDKLEDEKVQAKKDQIELKKAVLGVANAGISEILQGVKAGVITGDEALTKVKKIEQRKLQEKTSEANAKVQKAKAAAAALESSIEQDKQTVVKVKSAEKAADNTAGSATGGKAIAELDDKIDQKEKSLNAQKSLVKDTEAKAASELKAIEVKQEQLNSVTEQEQRSVQRSEKAEASTLKKVDQSEAKDAVKVGAERGAAEEMRKKAQTSKEEAMKATSSLLQKHDKQSEDQALENEKATEKQLSKDEAKLDKDKAKARAAMKALLAKIMASLHKVAVGIPSTDTPLERQQERKVETAAKDLQKQKEISQKDHTEQLRVQNQVTRRKDRLEQTKHDLVELEADVKSAEKQASSEKLAKEAGADSADDSLDTDAGDVGEKLTEDEENQLKGQIKQKETAAAQEELDLKKSEQLDNALETKVEQAEREQQVEVRALKRAEEEKVMTKAAETTRKLKEEGKGAEAKALEIEAARKSEVEQKDAEEARDVQDIRKAEADEKIAEEDEKDSAESPQDPHQDMKDLAKTFLNKAGFGWDDRK